MCLGPVIKLAAHNMRTSFGSNPFTTFTAFFTGSFTASIRVLLSYVTSFFFIFLFYYFLLLFVVFVSFGLLDVWRIFKRFAF